MSVQRGHERPVPTSAAAEAAAGEAQVSAHHVQLAGSRVSLTATRRDPDRFRGTFERARAEVGHARCLCCTGRPRLVIRRRGGRYWLACWPGGGADHDPACRFFDDETDDRSAALSGRHRYTRSALDESGGGEARIRLAEALTVGPRDDHTQPSGSTTSTGQQRRMSLLGLLHYLWERAELNGLGPPHWQRDWAACSRALQGVLSQLAVNGELLAGRLWVVPPYRAATAPIHKALLRSFDDRLTRTRTSARRGLVLGAVKDLSPTPHGHRLHLRHHPVPLYLSTELRDRIARSAPHAFSDRRPAGSERIVLAMIEKSPRGYHTIVTAAVMLTSRAHIPADSSYEVRMADALAAAGRTFVKPLRYDSSTDVVFPDFVLLDTDPPIVVEVWGMPGREDYARRREEKLRYYGADAGSGAEGVPLLEWDVRDPLPAIGPPPGP